MVFKLSLNKLVVINTMFVCVFLAGCSAESNGPVATSPVMDDWVQEEVLTQVDSMRKEIIALKKELKTVGEKLEVHLGGKENIKPTSI